MITTSTSNLSALQSVMSSLYGVGAVSRTASAVSQQTGRESVSSGLARQQSAFEVQISSFGRLQSALGDLRQTLGQLDSAGEVSPFLAASGNKAVLSASAGAGVSKAGQYPVDVQQTAASQVLQSGTFSSRDAALGAGRLTIETGRFSETTKAFSAGGKALTLDFSQGNSSLAEVANRINAADAGIRAEVKQASGGGYTLALTGPSGSEGNLRIRAQDSASGQSLTTGLGQMAYDPSASSGNGLTQTQAAQDAVVKVDGRTITSASNTINAGIEGVTITLAGTGTTNVDISANRDVTAFRKAAEQLVGALGSFQEATSGLATNNSSLTGGARQGDRVLTDLQQTIDRTLSSTGQGYGTNRVTLADLGISRRADGTVALSASDLERTYAANPENAMGALSQAARTIGEAIDQSTRPGGDLNSVTRGLQQGLSSVTDRRSLLDTLTQSATNSATSQGVPGLATWMNSGSNNPSSLFSYMFSGANNGLSAAQRYRQIAGMGSV